MGIKECILFFLTIRGVPEKILNLSYFHFFNYYKFVWVLLHFLWMIGKNVC